MTLNMIPKKRSYHKEYTLHIQKLWSEVKCFCTKSEKQTGQKMYQNFFSNDDISSLIGRKHVETSILKVLHGNTKSPTGCMYSWRYNILLEVKEGICSSFKIKEMCLSLYALLLRTLVTDLNAKNRHNICKGIEKSLENWSICEIY